MWVEGLHFSIRLLGLVEEGDDHGSHPDRGVRQFRVQNGPCAEIAPTFFLRVVDGTTDRCTRRNRSNTSAWFGLRSHDLVRLLVDGRAESDRRWPLGGRPRA